MKALLSKSLCRAMVPYVALLLLSGCSDHHKDKGSSGYKGQPISKEAPARPKSPQAKSIDNDHRQSRVPNDNKNVDKAPEKTIDEPESLIARKAAEEIGRSVSLEVKYRKRLKKWMYWVGIPRETNGDPLDYGKTNLAAQAEEGMLDDVLMALLQQVDGAWEILEFSIGATDAPFFDWSEKHGIPLELFSGDEN